MERNRHDPGRGSSPGTAIWCGQSDAEVRGGASRLWVRMEGRRRRRGDTVLSRGRSSLVEFYTCSGDTWP